MKYYIGDTHFGHENVIKHDQRPFQNVDEMDRILIENWNNRVKNNDDVYIIGDLIFRNDKNNEWYLKQLNGIKYLIVGNHDKALLNDKRALRYFTKIDKVMDILDDGKHVCMCHFPMTEWNRFYKGGYHVYAHIHNNINEAYNFMKKYDNALNAGCMINNYMPVTLSELIVNNKLFKEQN